MNIKKHTKTIDDMEKQWIEKLRKRFDNRQMPVSDDVWSGISAAMNNAEAQPKPVVAPVRRMRRLSLWTGRVAVAAAVAAVVAGVWHYAGTDVASQAEQSYKVAAYAKGGAAASAAAPSIDDETSPVARLLSAVSPNVSRHISGMTTEAHDVASATADAAAVKPTVGETIATDRQSEDTKTAKPQNLPPSKERASQSAADSRRNHTTRPYNADLLAHSSSKSAGGGASFGLYGSNFTSLGSASGSVSGSAGYVGTHGNAVVRDDNKVNFLSSNAGVLDVGDGTAVKVKHRQPVKLGLSVRMRLNRRLALESGLTYSYLSSDISSGDSRGGYATSQKLHYVGVPLNLNVDLWHNDRLEVYASGGGAVDICVSGRSETETFAGNEVTSHENKAMRETRPQLSVNASAGVQYNINRKLGVYAEPGVGYYFDNGSDVQTIYKDNKLNFNLNVGLRLTLK